MPNDSTLEFGRSLPALPVQVFVRRDGKTLQRAIFSPDSPRLLGVLVENAPPQFFDLRTAEGPEAVREANLAQQAGRLPVILDDEFLIKLPCNLPGTAIAFRPELSGASMEAAVAFGGEDDVVQRLDVLGLRKRTPLPFENAVAIAYSADGSLIAVGSSTGIVAAYDIRGDEPEILGGEVNVGGSVVSLCFQRDNQELRVATDCNTFGRVYLTNFDTGHWEQSAFDIDDRPEVTALNLHQIACSQLTGLLAFGGTGPEIWVFNPEYGQGKLITVPDQNCVRQLQFVDDRDELVILGDRGIEVIGFERNCFELPERPRLLVTHAAKHEALTFIGFHQYNDALCIASPDPEF